MGGALYNGSRVVRIVGSEGDGRHPHFSGKKRMPDHNVCIAVAKDHDRAAGLVKCLIDAGFDQKKISVVGKDHPEDEHVHGYVTTGESVAFWGKQGALWGGLFGALAGAGFLFIPGIGPLMVGGPLLSMIVGGLEGGAVLGGIEAVFAGMLHLGLTKDSLALYDTQLRDGCCLVILHGTAEEVVGGRDLLRGQVELLEVHAT